MLSIVPFKFELIVVSYFMLKNYFTIAFRNISKYKVYSFINISGLAVGIALCLLILMYVKQELSYDRFHEKSDRIVRVNTLLEDREVGVTPSAVAPTLKSNFPEVENWARIYIPTTYSPVIITSGENKFQENSFVYADSTFFELFTFTFLAGNPATALNNPRSLVLPKSTADKLFGTIDVIGEHVAVRIFNSNIDFEITGVIEDIPENSHIKFDYLGSMTTISGWSQLSDTEFLSANFYTYLLLQSEEALSTLQLKIKNFIANTNTDNDYIVDFPIIPITDIYLYSSIDYEITAMSNIQNIYGFTFLAFMILLIAVTNYVNLATARAARRGVEVGIRKTFGAFKAQLVKQFFGESIILTIIAVVFAVLLVDLFNESFFNLLGKNIEVSIYADPSLWIILISVALVTSIIAGCYPAILLSSYQPINVLKGNTFSGPNDGRLRRMLVIFQFAISTFLILSTIIIYQQTDYILSKNLGFDKEQIVVLPARDNELYQNQNLLKSEVLKLQGIVSATYMSNIPGKVFGGYTSESSSALERISTLAGAADSDLINTMGIKILAGNGFPTNPNYSKEQGYVYLINESLANAYGWTPEEAIGKPFNVLGNREGEVVGVVNDINVASLHQQIEPLALFIDSEMYNYLLVKIAPSNTIQSLAALEKVWDQVAPHRPFEFEFLDQQLNAQYQSEIQTRNLLTLFSILAIFIACAGLIGLSSFMVERRAKEIGIRKVLGASVSSIITLLSTDFLKLVGFGFLIGTPIAWYVMHRWLQNFAYQIDIGIAGFIIAGFISVVIALVTVSWHSVIAAIANPVERLRND